MKKRVILVLSFMVIFVILSVIFVNPPVTEVLPMIDVQEEYSLLKSKLENTKTITIRLKYVDTGEEIDIEKYTKTITNPTIVNKILDIFNRAETIREPENNDIVMGDLKKIWYYYLSFVGSDEEVIHTFSLGENISVEGGYIKLSQKSDYEELLQIIESEVEFPYPMNDIVNKEWDYGCLESQLGAYITSESDIPNQISLKKLADVEVDRINYYQAKRNQKKDIYVILNTTVGSIIEKVDQYFDANYDEYQSVYLEADLKVYVYNRSSDFDLEKDLQVCYKEF